MPRTSSSYRGPRCSKRWHAAMGGCRVYGGGLATGGPDSAVAGIELGNQSNAVESSRWRVHGAEAAVRRDEWARVVPMATFTHNSARAREARQTNGSQTWRTSGTGT